MKEENENKRQRMLQNFREFLKRRSSETNLSSIKNEEELSEIIAEESIRSIGREDLRQNLKSIHEKMEKKRSVSRYRRWAIAASILFFSVSSYVLISNITNQTMSSDEIYAAYFEPYPNLYNQRDPDNTLPDSSLLTQAIKAYSNQQFELALQAFDLAEQKRITFSIPEQFYYAVVLLKLNRGQEAVDQLVALKTKEVGPLSEQVNWYLALAYVKIDKMDQARTILSYIAQQKHAHFKQEEAKAILEHNVE